MQGFFECKLHHLGEPLTGLEPEWQDLNLFPSAVQWKIPSQNKQQIQMIYPPHPTPSTAQEEMVKSPFHSMPALILLMITYIENVQFAFF